MTRIRWYGPSLILLLTVVLVMVTGSSIVRQVAWAQSDANIKLVKDGLSHNEALADLSNAFRKVVQAVEPSVVSIEVYSSKQPDAGNGHLFGSDIPPNLRRFFNLPPDGNHPAPNPKDKQYQKYNPPTPYGSGSGWVYDNDGHIITNNHVVENADKIRVKFSDGATYDAKVVGTDPHTDVAVLKIDAKNLHPATIANQPVEQGDIVFAFGSPFRFQFSVSQGIVSAKGRQLHIIGPGGYEDYIQTDAAINPGNSGGPLTNIYGRVVGMNSAIASRTGAFNGLGFAIPVKMVVNVAKQLIASPSHTVSRGYLGIYINDLKPKMAKTFGFNGEGVLVVEPIKGSPAAKAGVEEGDIITEVNGKDVTSADKLRYEIAAFTPGSTVKLTVFRGGKTLTIPVTLAQLPNNTMASAETPSTEQAPQPGSEGMQTLQKLGIDSIETFTKAMAAQVGIDYQPGALIKSVRPNSVAAAAGLNRGMIVTRVMGQSVKTAGDLVEQMAKHDPTKGIRIRIAQWDPQQHKLFHRFVLLELPSE